MIAGKSPWYWDRPERFYARKANVGEKVVRENRGDRDRFYSAPGPAKGEGKVVPNFAEGSIFLFLGGRRGLGFVDPNGFRGVSSDIQKSGLFSSNQTRGNSAVKPLGQSRDRSGSRSTKGRSGTGRVKRGPSRQRLLRFYDDR